jgi:hypothetical protein
MLCFARLGLHSLFDKNEQPNCLNLIKPTFELMTFYPFQFIGLFIILSTLAFSNQEEQS